jgi:LysM repeat protein
MKILKIFGIVVGIHLFALILIFANPGCSSTTKPTPPAGDADSKAAPAPVVSLPAATPSATTVAAEATSSAISFNPNAPAAPAPAASTGERFVPTRPGTPVAGALLSEPVADVVPASSYTVKSGDNLWTIARKNNITVAQLTAANSLSANASLRPGQKLVIPGKQMSAAASVPLAPISGSTTKSPDPLSAASAGRSTAEGLKHVVKSGETLGGIARKYDVRQGELAVANNISDPARIRPGMELVIPGYQTPKSGKAAKSTNGKSTPQPSAPVNVEPPAAQPAPAPALNTPPPVPVIRIDDPAPKQP